VCQGRTAKTCAEPKGPVFVTTSQVPKADTGVEPTVSSTITGVFLISDDQRSQVGENSIAGVGVERSKQP
jgi:hypothetical protein